jgi:hypothetical protein
LNFVAHFAALAATEMCLGHGLRSPLSIRIQAYKFTPVLEEPIMGVSE